MDGIRVIRKDLPPRTVSNKKKCTENWEHDFARVEENCANGPIEEPLRQTGRRTQHARENPSRGEDI